jgi:transcriptional regulator of NAD metabolism
MWNIFKKFGKGNQSQLRILETLALKKMEKMSPQEKEKMMQEALKPENRNQLLSAMEQLKKTGLINEDQEKLAKEKLGL